MAPGHLPPGLCGAYDTRHIQSILRYLNTRVRGMEANARQRALAKASRLPGLPGRFMYHPDLGVLFQPDPPEGRPTRIEISTPITPY